jgi:hypothetical protein
MSQRVLYPLEQRNGLLGLDFLTLCGATIDVKRSQIVIW